MKRLLPIAACLLLAQPLVGVAQTIDPASPIETMVDDISKSLEAAIDNTENAARVSSFEVRSDLLVLADNVRQMGDSLVGKTFGELNEAQQTFFRNALLLSSSLRQGIDLTGDRVEEVLRGVEELASRLPGVDGRPFVTKYSPTYFMADAEGYRLRVVGSLLGSSKPTLTFSAGECTATSKTERELYFQCPPEVFAKPDAWASGQLTVFGPRPFWALFSAGAPFLYRVEVKAVSQTLGTFDLTSFSVTTHQERKSRSQSNYHRNDFCQGGRNVSWTYTPASGCKIDVGSVTSHATTRSSNSSLEGPSSVTASGFIVKGRVNNSGDCGPRVFGARVGKDARGALGVEASWIDICETTEEIPTTAMGELRWGRQESISFPPNTNHFVLTVHQTNGEQRVITGREEHAWFDVEYTPGTNLLVIRPKPIATALQ